MGCNFGPFRTRAAVCFPSTICTYQTIGVMHRLFNEETNLENDHFNDHIALPGPTNTRTSNAYICILANVDTIFTMA